MLKRFLRSPAVQSALGRLLGCYMLFVGRTTRWTYVDRAIVEKIWADGGPVVACIWHARILLVHCSWAIGKGGQPAKMLISQSRDGGVVAEASRTVGAEVIRGSTAKGDKRKGGFEAMREMLRHLGGGGVMCVTPDGPRGPRMRASLGPVQLAKLAGAPIVCIAWSSSSRKVFDTWDRFVLPLPFGRGVLVWGGPIRVPREADANAMERARAALEAELNRITAEADRRAGVDAIAPAEAVGAQSAAAA